jgi:hypothetical protein
MKHLPLLLLFVAACAGPQPVNVAQPEPIAKAAGASFNHTPPSTAYAEAVREVPDSYSGTIVSATISGAGTTTSTTVYLIRDSLLSLHWVSTGTLSGTWTWEVSDDSSGTNWVAVTDANILAFLAGDGKVNGSASANYFDWSGIGAYAMRVKFVYTSGSGDLTVYANAKRG